MKEDGDASDKPLDIAVLTRMKQFRAMNKLKKVALKVKYLYFTYVNEISNFGINFYFPARD